MKNKLIIVMDNGIKYEYFNPVDIVDIDDFTDAIKSLGFFRQRTINDRNYILIGVSDGGNVLINEDKVASYEFKEL